MSTNPVGLNQPDGELKGRYTRHVGVREVKEKAARLVAQGQFARAEVLLRQVLTQTPRDAQAWLRHAEVLKRLSRPADAVASYRLAARILDDEGHHPRAAAALKLALSLLPDDIDLITDIIRSEMKTRRGQAAVRSVFPISSPSQLLATVPASSASSIARDAEGVQLALPSAPVAGAAPAVSGQHLGPNELIAAAPTSTEAQAGSAPQDLATVSIGANPPAFAASVADTREASPTGHSAASGATASEGEGTESFGSAIARRSGVPAELIAGEPPSGSPLTHGDAPAGGSNQPGAPDAGLSSRTGPPDELALGSAGARRSGAPAESLAGDPSGRLTDDDAPASGSYRPGAPDAGLAGRTGPPDDLALGSAGARRSDAPAESLAGDPSGRLTDDDAPARGSYRPDAGLASAQRPPDGVSIGITHAGAVGGGLADRARSPDRVASDVRDGGAFGAGFPEGGAPHDAAARVTEARSFTAGHVNGEAPHDTATSGMTRAGPYGAGLDTGRAALDGANSGAHASATGDGFRPGRSAHEFGAGLVEGRADAASSANQLGAFEGESATHDRAWSDVTYDGAFGPEVHGGHAASADPFELLVNDVRARARDAGTAGSGTGVGAPSEALASEASGAAVELALEVRAGPDDWPQVRRLSARAVAIRAAPGARWVVVSGDLLEVRFTDELDVPEDAEWLE
ncbi:MAG: tetratricopeptide repeat protein [Myxococcaceae bacterium]|nr:tetratricopeptide repeat protein [Myxococcaceae bacterium]